MSGHLFHIYIDLRYLKAERWPELRFIKMHGLGNDFVMIDCFAQGAPEEEDLPALARAVCERRFGIGADGLILVLPPAASLAGVGSDDAAVVMRMFNPDGSEAEMCGNGIRCLARLVYERHPELCSKDRRLLVETRAGLKVIEVVTGAGGRFCAARVDMGVPVYGPIEGDAPGPGPEFTGISAAGREVFGVRVSMGNPHFVVPVEDDPASYTRALGPSVERHGAFKEGTNVEFIKVLGPGEIVMRVWERGAGETLACGTGACASLVAAAAAGLSGRRAVVHLAGGDLDVEWGVDGHVYMTGPAEEVFTGEFDARRLAKKAAGIKGGSRSDTCS